MESHEYWIQNSGKEYQVDKVCDEWNMLQQFLSIGSEYI